MTIWAAIIAASLVVWALKTAGYVLPRRFIEGAAMSRVATVVTVALLASLVVSQTVQTTTGIALDARLPALGVAAVLLYYRAPFLVVLIAAGFVAAGFRFFGILA
jgi:branched-subunit amino acid transport protein